nr:uncharacterized protein LOC109189292 [Ipomoea trifida]
MPVNHPEPARWTKPAHGWIKVNVDTAINNDLKTTGLGCIIRNVDGNFVAAKEIAWRGHYQPREVEAISIREVSNG